MPTAATAPPARPRPKGRRSPPTPASHPAAPAAPTIVPAPSSSRRSTAAAPRPAPAVPATPPPTPGLTMAQQVAVLADLMPGDQIVRAAGADRLVDAAGGRAYLAAVRGGAADPVERMLVDLQAAAHQAGLGLAAAAGDLGAQPAVRVAYAGAATRVLAATAAAAESLARYRASRLSGPGDSGAGVGSNGAGAPA